MKTLFISEEFSSIQGEGQFTGIPSYFVRTSGCNLRCWWCDTPYTSWNATGSKVNVADIAERIAHDPARHVVITGGEPMLQAPAVAELTGLCHIIGKPVTIETNGTLHDPLVRPHLWSVSPKLPSSTPSDENMLGAALKTVAAEASRHLAAMKATDLRQFLYPQINGIPGGQFKFVVTNEADVLQVQNLVTFHKLPPATIWLMPEGRTAAEVMAKHAWVAEACKRTGYNMSTRLHTLIWGAKRGV